VTEDRTMFLTIVVCTAVTVGVAVRYKDAERKDWPWWATTIGAAASAAAATCIGRYAESRRLR